MSKYNTPILLQNDQKTSLSDDEFETLIKNVQLLKTPQINYIINKYSLPILNKNTDLINYLMIQRHETSMKTIFNEIEHFILDNENQLQITQYDSRFQSPPNIMNDQSNPPFIFGPIFVPAGQYSGKFQFKNKNEIDSNKFINISFLFLNGISHQFSLECEFNNFSIEVSPDDPYPQPIDVTDLMLFNSETNVFEIKIIQTSQPMMICIREYTYNDIDNIMEKIIGHHVNAEKEDFYVYSNECHHNDSFLLVDFISTSLATGEWKCPICSNVIDPFKLKINRNINVTNNFS